jgi:hypothetical protein
MSGNRALLVRLMFGLGFLILLGSLSLLFGLDLVQQGAPRGIVLGVLIVSLLLGLLAVVARARFSNVGPATTRHATGSQVVLRAMLAVLVFLALLGAVGLALGPVSHRIEWICMVGLAVFCAMGSGGAAVLPMRGIDTGYPSYRRTGRTDQRTGQSE